jgi:uncharacterized HAD superfamily protein
MRMTLGKNVTNAIDALEIGDKLDKVKFITLHWGDCDYFIERSFDVAFCTAKKKFPERKFESKKKMIIRTS